MINQINSFNNLANSTISFKSNPIKKKAVASNTEGKKLDQQLSLLALNNRNYLNIISFKGAGAKNDDLSFDNFDKMRKLASIETLDDLASNIKEENALGEGLNSRVYSFDDPRLSRWALKVDKNEFNNDSDELFTPTYDEFAGKNMGQEIAVAGNQYRILKKIDAEVHSIDNWSDHVNNDSKVTTAEAKEFLSQLKKVSDLPQETFDSYASRLELLQEKGYKQDSINPNNLLIDYKNQEIYIIDFYKADSPVHTNSRLDLINPLLDFSLFNNFYDKLDESERRDLIDSAREVIAKCNMAAKKTDLALDEKTYIDYITEVDKWFGCHLIHKGGDYRSRYNNLKALLEDNSVKL